MEHTPLKRSLSLILITFYGLGTILGADIYVLVGKVAASAGLYAPIAFLVASLLAGFTAFSYGELSARLPRSAGEAVYVETGLRVRFLSIAVGLLVVSTGIVSTTALANGVVGYLRFFIDVPDWLTITVMVVSLGLLAAWGITESVTAAMLITVLEIGGLLLVIGVAGDGLIQLPERWPDLIPPADGGVWLGILLGAFLAFYAFIGFEDMVNVAEEVKTPGGRCPPLSCWPWGSPPCSIWPWPWWRCWRCRSMSWHEATPPWPCCTSAAPARPPP